MLLLVCELGIWSPAVTPPSIVSEELSDDPFRTIDSAFGESPLNLGKLLLSSHGLRQLSGLVKIVKLNTGLRVEICNARYRPGASNCESRNEPVTLAIGLGLTFALVSAVRYVQSPWRRLPPGPPGLPIVGNALQISGKQWLQYSAWKKEYGKHSTFSIN